MDVWPAPSGVSESRSLLGSLLVIVKVVKAGAGVNEKKVSVSRFWPTVTAFVVTDLGVTVTVSWLAPPAGVEYPAGVPAVITVLGGLELTVLALKVALALVSPPLIVTEAGD